MRTNPPQLLPVLRSDMQARLLALLLLQPERSWTLGELTDRLGTPSSSVHRELERGEASGLVLRDVNRRPYHFKGDASDPVSRALAELLRLTVGVEVQLRGALDRADVEAAWIHGSWVAGPRRPDSDVDVLVIGDAELRSLRRAVRPVGDSVGRTIDLTLMNARELRDLLANRSSFARKAMDGPAAALVGDRNTLPLDG